MVGAIIGGVVFGFISDRWGRRRSMIVALMCASPWFRCGRLLLPCVVDPGRVLMQFMVQGAWGIIPAHFPNCRRIQCVVFFPDLLINVACCWLDRSPTSKHYSPNDELCVAAMSLTAVTVFAGAILVIALGREKRGINFGEVEISE